MGSEKYRYSPDKVMLVSGAVTVFASNTKLSSSAPPAEARFYRKTVSTFFYKKHNGQAYFFRNPTGT